MRGKSIGLLVLFVGGCATGNGLDVTNGGNPDAVPIVDSHAGDGIVDGGDAIADSTSSDARDAATDSTSSDGASTDTGGDGGAGDVGVDTAPIDSGAIDSGVIDSGEIDTGKTDTGAIDVGPPDTGFDSGVDSGHDTGPIDTGVDTTPTCVPGAPCDSGDPCKLAAITCTAGGPLCAITGRAPDGTSCGAGMVCSGGTCTPCAAGTSCTASGACKTATIDCSTGAPVCTDTGNLPDGTSCGPSMTCAGGVCGCTGGKTDCSGTCVDTTTDPSHCGSCTNVCGAATTCISSACVPSSVTVDFPTSSDPWHTAVGVYYFWNSGDWVQGTRTVSLSSTTHATIHINVMYNGLTCDNQDMRMLINGVEVGRFSITPGMATLDTSFTFPTETGPTYTLRYETVRTVTGSCGSASFGPGTPTPTGSTVTLSP